MVEVDDGDGIIILTDILGGTPTNLSLPFLKDDGVQIVTGVNVPMLLALSSYRSGRSVEEVCDLVRNSGRRSIVLVKHTLRLKKRTGRPNPHDYPGRRRVPCI